VVASDKALAEVICRGLAGMPGLELEIEVAFSGDAAERLLGSRGYDALVVGSGNGHLRGPRVPEGLPTVAVGGDPAVGVPRVPLPLSYRLLERAVRGALFGGDDRGEEPARRRDSIG
jgi:hypothetical protein